MKLSHILNEGMQDDIIKKYNLTKVSGSVGFSEDEQKWYGWSHRAIVGFGIGDKIFEEDFGDDDTPYVKHGSKTINTMDDAKLSAKRISSYLS